MNRKTFTAVVVAVCLALVFAAVASAERSRDPNERTKRTLVRDTAEKKSLADSYDPRFDPNRGVVITNDEPDIQPIDLDQLAELGLTAGAPAELQAYSLLRQAARQGVDEARASLRGVLQLDLSSSPQRAQILADTHRRLAETFTEPTRRVYHLTQQLGYTVDPEAQSALADEIRLLGGVVTSQDLGGSARNFGPDDLCTNAPAVGVPSSTTMSIDDPFFIPGFGLIEDTNFVSFDIPFEAPGNPHQPLIGKIVRVETTSSQCSSEAECSNAAYDTALALYGKCDPDGRPELRFAFDEGPGDAGLGWLAAVDGQGTCMDVTGKYTGQSCFVDRDCQASQGGSQSQGFCMEALCLPAGTYYVEAKGDFGNAPKNFAVDIEVIGDCLIPRGDDFESDNATIDANNIAFGSSQPDKAKAFGRANKEIQAHTIVAPGGNIDEDYVKMTLSRDEMVRFSTAVTHPTPKNGFFSRPAGQSEDTAMSILYDQEQYVLGGLCNHNSSFRAGSFVSLGCRAAPGANDYGLPGLGLDITGKCQANITIGPRFFNIPTNYCVPNYLVSFLADNFDTENPLMANDNTDAASGNYGSTVEICVPKNGDLFPTGNLAAKVTTSPSNPRAPLLNYFYELRGQNLSPCKFEHEPNQTPMDASPIDFGDEVFGLGDVADSRLTNVVLPVGLCDDDNALCLGGDCNPGATCVLSPPVNAYCIPGFYDFDYWGPFDLPGVASIILRLDPQIIDPDAETDLSLVAGPTTSGQFVTVADADDTLEPISELVLEDQPPAGEWLASMGLDSVDAKYYAVTGMNPGLGDAGSSIPNYYYKFSLTAIPPKAEVEPNDDCDTTTQTAELGDTWVGELFPSGGTYIAGLGIFEQDCDLDAYRISLTENTSILLTTDGDPAATDTAIQIEDCTSGEVIACDDDGQNDDNGTYWSKLSGCLPPGDYCVRVRAWNGLGPEFGLNGIYNLRFKGTPGCDPDGDPATGDDGSSCTGSSSPFDTFCDGDGDGTPNSSACSIPLE